MFWCYKQLNLSLVFFYNFYKFLISWKLVDILSDTHGPTLNWEFLWLNVLCFKYFHVFLFCLNPKGCTSETSVQQRKQLENILNSCPQSLHLHKTNFFFRGVENSSARSIFYPGTIQYSITRNFLPNPTFTISSLSAANTAPASRSFFKSLIHLSVKLYMIIIPKAIYLNNWETRSAEKLCQSINQCQTFKSI